MKLFLTLFAIVFFHVAVSAAEVKTLNINPSAVNAKTAMMRGTHVVYWDSTVKNNNKLFQN